MIGFPNNINEEEEEAEDEEDDSTNDDDNDDDDDDDDDDDITIPLIQYHDIARADAFHWRTLTSNMITSWEQRAAYLNTRPVPGLLSTFPHVNLPRLELEIIVKTALQVDWRSLCTSIQSSIKRLSQTDFDKVVVFGNERVLLQL